MLLDSTITLCVVCVHMQEVRIATEGKELEDIAEKSPLLCSCFIILERAIVYVSQHSGEDAKSQGVYVHHMMSHGIT